MPLPSPFISDPEIQRNFESLELRLGALEPISDYIRTLIDDVDAATARATLGKVPAADEAGLKVIRGIVNTTSPGTIIEGVGFTITRTQTGDVTVNFTVAFSGVPAVVAVGEVTGAIICNAIGVTASAARITRRSTAGTLTDGVYHFIAIGPS